MFLLIHFPGKKYNINVPLCGINEVIVVPLNFQKKCIKITKNVFKIEQQFRSSILI